MFAGMPYWDVQWLCGNLPLPAGVIPVAVDWVPYDQARTWRYQAYVRADLLAYPEARRALAEGIALDIWLGVLPHSRRSRQRVA